MDFNLIKKPELEIVTVRFEWNESDSYDSLQIKKISGYEGTFEDMVLLELKSGTTNQILKNSDKQIDFEKSKVILKIKRKDGNPFPIIYEYKLIEMIDIQILTNAILKKNKYIEYLQKNLELQEIQIEEMKKEKIIFAGYQTPIIKEMKLKANQ